MMNFLIYAPVVIVCFVLLSMTVMLLRIGYYVGTRRGQLNKMLDDYCDSVRKSGPNREVFEKVYQERLMLVKAYHAPFCLRTLLCGAFTPIANWMPYVKIDKLEQLSTNIMRHSHELLIMRVDGYQKYQQFFGDEDAHKNYIEEYLAQISKYGKI